MAWWWLLIWSWVPPQVSTSQLKTCFTHLDPTSSNTFSTTEDGRFRVLGLGWHFPSKSNMQDGQSMTSIKVKSCFWKRKGISGKIDDMYIDTLEMVFFFGKRVTPWGISYDFVAIHVKFFGCKLEAWDVYCTFPTTRHQFRQRELKLPMIRDAISK